MPEKYPGDDEIINSVNGLKDERAKKIAKEYELDINEILPNALEIFTGRFIESLYSKHGDNEVTKVTINVKDSSIPVNIFSIMARKHACAAVVAYEMTKNEKVTLPLAKGFCITKIQKNLPGFDFLDTVGVIIREEPIRHYEEMGNVYESNILELIKGGKAYVDMLEKELG